MKKQNKEGLARWQHNRFGMFIHWGLYALAARHEWVKSREQMPEKEYEKYFGMFNPDLYDPAQWAKDCKAAGMKYVVITTKHHDGFCLWDTKQTDYNATNTPYGKDLLKPFVRAFRNEGIRIGWYHSLLDWHHPHYTLDSHHPHRNDPAAQKKDGKKDIAVYAKYLHAQVKELLTKYGEIDMLFFDFSADKGREQWQSEKLVEMIRKLCPDILINDRLDLLDKPWGWDYRTPEQCMLRSSFKMNGNKVPWETCQTFSGSWGYYRDEYSWKSNEQLIKMLIDTVSKDGNLLLNVGPTARGTFDERAVDRLHGMGRWMDQHGRSIYGCGEAPNAFVTPQDCRLTYNPAAKRLYIHLFSWPSTGELYLEGGGIKRIKYAQLLHDGSELKVGALAKWQMLMKTEDDSATISFKLPIRKPDTEVPVVELFLK